MNLEEVTELAKTSLEEVTEILISAQEEIRLINDRFKNIPVGATIQGVAEMKNAIAMLDNVSMNINNASRIYTPIAGPIPPMVIPSLPTP